MTHCGILYCVMEEACNERLVVRAQLGQQAGHFHRMRDVGLAGLPQLAGVDGEGQTQGLMHLSPLICRQVVQQRFQAPPEEILVDDRAGQLSVELQSKALSCTLPASCKDPELRLLKSRSSLHYGQEPSAIDNLEISRLAEVNVMNDHGMGMCDQSRGTQRATCNRARIAIPQRCICAVKISP